MEKVARMWSLSRKTFQRKTTNSRQNCHRKSPQSKCNDKDKGNVLKKCRKRKGRNIFVDEEFSQEALKHRRQEGGKVFE